MNLYQILFLAQRMNGFDVDWQLEPVGRRFVCQVDQLNVVPLGREEQQLVFLRKV